MSINTSLYNADMDEEFLKNIPNCKNPYGDENTSERIINITRDYLIHGQMEHRSGKTYDMVVDLDITSPLRRVVDIEHLIERHLECQPDVTTSVTLARRNPYFNQLMMTEHGAKKVIESNYTARQQAPEIFDMNASLYAYSLVHLRSGKGVLDGYCEMIEMKDTGVLDLDHENDMELMEVIAEYLYRNDEEFNVVRANICEI